MIVGYPEHADPRGLTGGGGGKSVATVTPERPAAEAWIDHQM
jgi:hypothetical protein